MKIFSLSKLVTLAALVASATSLSAYLITMGFSSDKFLSSIFQKNSSIYDDKEVENFSIEEKKKLEKLTNSFNKLFKALSNSKELREFINAKMEELFKFIFNSENVLSDLYKEHIQILQKLSELFDKQLNYNKERIEKQSKFEETKYSREFFEKLSKAVEGIKSPFESFLSEINTNSSKNQISREGGAVII